MGDMIIVTISTTTIGVLIAGLFLLIWERRRGRSERRPPEYPSSSEARSFLSRILRLMNPPVKSTPEYGAADEIVNYWRDHPDEAKRRDSIEAGDTVIARALATAAKRIEPQQKPETQDDSPLAKIVSNLVSISIGIIGVLITGYYAFAVSGAPEDSEFVNLGLLSQAERGAVFGLCLVGLGGIIAVIDK